MKGKIIALFVFSVMSIFLVGCDFFGSTTTTGSTTSAVPTTAVTTTAAPTSTEALTTTSMTTVSTEPVTTTEVVTTTEPAITTTVTTEPATTTTVTTEPETTTEVTTETTVSTEPVTTTEAVTTTEPATTTTVTTEPATTTEVTTETSVSTIAYPFVPGSEGALPVVTGLVSEEGEFAGLYVVSVDRHSYISGYTNAEVYIEFPIPASIGAETFTLQYFDTSDQTWKNYSEGTEYTTDYNNFVLTSPDILSLRLYANGGVLDGKVSNTVTTSSTSIETRFSGWSLDESMFISGIMHPFVGRGLEASFTVVETESGDPVTSGLTYLWYRINPYTFEHIAITGASALTYITTEADLGYYIGIVATGDEITVGGKMEIISMWMPVLMPVEVFATNVSSSGFTLNLAYLVDGIGLDGLIVYNDQYEPVDVLSITQGENQAIYNVIVEDNSLNTSFSVSYQGKIWQLVSMSEEGMMMFSELNIDIIS